MAKKIHPPFQSDLPNDSVSPLFDIYRDYRHRQAVRSHDTADSNPDLRNGLLPNEPHLYITFEQDISPHERETFLKEPDYTSFIPIFGCQAVDIIKSTFAATMQYVRFPMSTHLTRHFNAPFPALNVHKRQEDVATDTVYSELLIVDTHKSSFIVGLIPLYVGLMV